MCRLPKDTANTSNPHQAQGRDSTERPDAAAHIQPGWNAPKDVYVPYQQNGTIVYALMEVIYTDQSGLYWELRHKVTNPQVPTVPTTSDQPRAVYGTSSGMPHQQS